MSGPAMHRVLLLGPRGDLNATIVLVVITDYPETDIDGRGTAIPSRLIAERAELTVWKTRAVLRRLLTEGWLELVQPGTSHRASTYRLGPRFPEWPEDEQKYARRQVGKPRAARDPRYENRAHYARNQAGNRALDVSTSIPARGGAGSPSAPPAATRKPGGPLGRCVPDCPICAGTGWVETEVPRGHVMRCPAVVGE
jgi:hypothetical protein